MTAGMMEQTSGLQAVTELLHYCCDALEASEVLSAKRVTSQMKHTDGRFVESL